MDAGCSYNTSYSASFILFAGVLLRVTGSGSSSFSLLVGVKCDHEPVGRIIIKQNVCARQGLDPWPFVQAQCLRLQFGEELQSSEAFWADEQNLSFEVNFV